MGDLVLQETARRLSSAVRRSDGIGRIGGDVFVLFIQNLARSEDARIVAEKIRLGFEERFNYKFMGTELTK